MMVDWIPDLRRRRREARLRPRYRFVPGPRAAGSAGFNLLEVMIALLILGIAATVVVPAIQRLILRSETEGAVRSAVALLRSARFEAIRRGTPVGVQMDFVDHLVFSYLEVADPPNGFTPGQDQELDVFALPAVVELWGPQDVTPEGDDASVGFPELPSKEGFAVFNVNGSVDGEGAFRLADARGNFLEVRVFPPATGKVILRKWEDHGSGDDWYEDGEDGVPWRWY